METKRHYPTRLAYLTFAVLAVAGLMFQVFLVGLSLLGGRPSWDTHIGFGHSFGVFLIILIGLAFFGRVPRTDKWLVWLFFGTYIIQAEVFAAIRDAVPLAAAFHPVLAMVMFATSVLVAWRAYALVRVPASVRLEADRASRGTAYYPLAGGAAEPEDKPSEPKNAGH